MSTQHTEQEIAKFDALAADFWNTEGEFKTLHQINPIRLEFVQSLVELNGARVVDVGCGGGILSESLAECGSTVTGVDLSSVGIGAAQSHQQTSGSSVDYRVQSIGDYADEIADNPLDCVCCMEMLEHVEEPAAIIADCARLLKPGGFAFFSTINRTKKAHLLAVIMAEYILRMVPQGTHDPKLFIKPSEMQRMAAQAGLMPLEMRGFEFRLLSNDFVRSHNTDINYIFAFQKVA